MIWDKIYHIFELIKKFVMNKVKILTIKTSKKEGYRSPEIGSGLVRISHKISSVSSKTQLVKIGEKYFRVKELG